MLKASSLLYAIFVCLIVSLLCGSLLLIFGYQLRLKEHYFLQEELIDAANNDLTVITSQLGEQSANTGNVTSLDERFTTAYSVSKWGYYNLLKTHTFYKNDTLHKAALIGGVAVDKRQALYMVERDKSLNIGGKTQIIGDVKVSKRGVTPAYINSHNFTGKKLVNGKVGVSERNLPKLQKFVDTTIVRDISDYVLLEEVLGISIHRSFKKPSLIVEVDNNNEVANVSLSGNIILVSQDSIHINKDSNLVDVLIQAPAVSIASGFSGAIQIFAERIVYLEPDANLLYPSSIYIENNTTDEVHIHLDKGSKMAGGIVLAGDSQKSANHKLVTIDEDALLVGDLYCNGKTQLKGKVIGTVYTTLFYLRTTASIYENYIVGGIINRLELPDSFIGLPLFTNENASYELIKEL